MRKAIKIFAAAILSLLILVCLTLAFIQTDWGQNWLTRKVTARLSRDLESRISIDHVRFSFFDKMNMEGVLVEDRKRDTLLYAGIVQVRITDWFFLKPNPTLEYIGLKDARINLQRTDSVWNYGFILDYFDSPSTGNKKESGLDFNLKKVLFENVAFVQKDAWVGNDFYLKFAKLDLDAEAISAKKRIIDISNITIDDPFFHQFMYTGNRPAHLKKKSSGKPAGAPWNAGGWQVSVAGLKLQNGTFRLDHDSLHSGRSFFDEKHIFFSNITGTVRGLNLTGDTLRAHTDLIAKERSGLVVKQLRSALRFHAKGMEFDKLLLRTNRSVLQDHFSMNFSDFGDLSDFIHAVRMKGNFRNSSVSSDDIAFFAPQIRDWNRQFEIWGKVTGTVDALDGKDVSIRSGSTGLTGDFSIQGLPDINGAFFNIEADELRTNYTDAVTFLPAIRNVTTPNLRTLGAIRFRGTYTGFLNDFVTYGTLQTALGSLRTDLNMKLPVNGDPVYSGTVSTGSFQLGRFFDNPQLGVVDFHGNLKGKGFTWSRLDLAINGSIHRIHYDGYTYQNITAKGRLNNKSFDGDFTINDPNAELTLNGLVTFRGDQPTFKVAANIKKANFKALQLTREDLSLSGNFDLDFTGSSLADFMGNASIRNATLLQDGKRLSLDSLVVTSNYSGGVRQFRARSNEFDAYVRGQFDLESLPDAFMLFLNRYYPAYIRPPRRHLPNQSFSFDITTFNAEDYIRLVDPRLRGFNYSHIKGSLNVAANQLLLEATVPYFAYEQYQFSDVLVNGNGDFNQLTVNGTLGNVVVKDSMTFPQTSFQVQARNDVSDITINTTSNLAINQANLSAQVRTFSDGVSILFNPSNFVLNGKTWTIQQGGALDFRRNSVVQGQVVLQESNQEIRLSTELSSDGGNWNDLHVALKNINLGDIAPFLTKANRIEGLVNGEIIVEDPQNRFNVTAQLTTEQLRVDNDSIGQLKADLSYQRKTGRLQGNAANFDPLHKIEVELDMDFDDSLNLHQDRISVKPFNYPVNYLENFIGFLFSDLQGFVTGQLNIVGEGRNRKFLGKARLHGAKMKVNFTQVVYSLDDADISLTEDKIDFGTLKLRDKDGNAATLRGGIYHDAFQDMEFDIQATVDGQPMELLNTGYNDNQTFYGRAKGTGTFILTGPQDAMNMYIEAKPSENPEDSSYITLPPSRSRETGSADFMVERKYGRELTSEELVGDASNIHYVVNLTANPNVTVEVILDDLTGDAIKGKGTGNLIIESGTNDPLTIRGRYNIEEGNYLFTFQSFFKKPFELRKGGNNYIEWTGDPYDARIQFEAIYKAERVSFAPLIQSLQIDDERLRRTRGDVNVIVTLTGELFRPTFKFNLAFPENSPVYTNPSFAYGLQQIENNTNLINKQVTFLIVFNTFAPNEGEDRDIIGNNTLNEFAYSTISGLFFGEVNRRLNQILSKVMRNNNFTFNFSGNVYNRNLVNPNQRGFDINQGEFNVSVSAPIIKERVQLTFGSTFDVPINSDLKQNIQVFPDVNLDILINKSGSIRATFFYSQTPDLLSSAARLIRNERAGVKLSYRKQFNSLRQIFSPKKPVRTTQGVPVTDSAGTN